TLQLHLPLAASPGHDDGHRAARELAHDTMGDRTLHFPPAPITASSIRGLEDKKTWLRLLEYRDREARKRVRRLGVERRLARRQDVLGRRQRGVDDAPPRAFGQRQHALAAGHIDHDVQRRLADLEAREREAQDAGVGVLPARRLERLAVPANAARTGLVRIDEA